MKNKAQMIADVAENSKVIKDEKTRKAINEYTNTLENEYSESSFANVCYCINDLIEYIQENELKIDDLNLFKIACASKYNFTRDSYHKIALLFFRFVFENNLSESLSKRPWINNVLIKDSFLINFFDDIIKNGEADDNIITYINFHNSHDYQYVISEIHDFYIMDLLCKFAQSRTLVREKKFFNEMAKYLKNRNIKNVYNEINDNLIKGFFEKYIDESPQFINLGKYFFIWILQDVEASYEKKECPLYGSVLLKYTYFTKNIKKGFKPVVYNKLDSVPEFDKWFLYPNNDIRNSTQLTDDTVLSIDFETIKNETLRYIEKEYFWYSNINVMTKSKDKTKISNFCNMYYPNKKENIKQIDYIICAQYKSYIIKKYSKTETRNGYIYPISAFLKYIDDKKQTIKIDPNCFIYLKNKGQLNRNGPKGVKEEHLEKLAAYFNEHKYDSMNKTVAYVIFHIALNTEFRISQIIALKTNCIVPGIKKNEYAIHSTTKVTAGEAVDQPCAIAVKRIIESYLKYSADFREKCKDPQLKEYLFLLVNNNSHHDYYVPDRGFFNDQLTFACDDLNIPKYTAKNLRVTYITNAKVYVIKNNLSDLEFVGISGHENADTANNHYLQELIKDALQATNKIIIGDFEVKGNIILNKSSINTSKEVTVENGCGYCQNPKDDCDCNGQISCLLCKHYATTIDRIPYYQHKIKQLNSMIKCAETPHDIQDLKNKVRLYARYLEELLILEKEEQYAGK